MRDPRPGSRSWMARWRDPNGSQRAKSFPRKVDADRFLASTTHGMHSGSYVDPAGGRTTFGEYAKTWRTGQVHRASSAAHVETMLRRHAYPAFGSRTLSSIRPSEVQSWVRRLSTWSDDRAALAPSTVGVVHGLVAAVFEAAIRYRLLSASPCEGVKLPKTEPRRVEPLSTETVHRLASEVPARYRALVILAAGTGLRQGEAFGVTLDRVDFIRRTLTVDRQMVQLVGQPPTFGPPKTRASHRTVPLPQVVVEELAEHLRVFPAGRDGLLFTTAKGEPIRRTGFYAVWRPAVQRAPPRVIRQKQAPLYHRMWDSCHLEKAVICQLEEPLLSPHPHLLGQVPRHLHIHL